MQRGHTHLDSVGRLQYVPAAAGHHGRISPRKLQVHESLILQRLVVGSEAFVALQRSWTTAGAGSDLAASHNALVSTRYLAVVGRRGAASRED